MRGEQDQMMVPVATLMCVDLRMASLLRDTRPVHRKELPLFLSLLDDVVDRWYEAVGSMNPVIYEQYNDHTTAVKDLQDCFKKVAEDDSEGVFEERQRLGVSIERIYELMDCFAEVFTAPVELREFYYNISSRIRLTVDAVTEGKHGW